MKTILFTSNLRRRLRWRTKMWQTVNRKKTKLWGRTKNRNNSRRVNLHSLTLPLPVHQSLNPFNRGKSVKYDWIMTVYLNVIFEGAEGRVSRSSHPEKTIKDKEGNFLGLGLPTTLKTISKALKSSKSNHISGRQKNQEVTQRNCSRSSRSYRGKSQVFQKKSPLETK